jgi:hypothetical protein
MSTAGHDPLLIARKRHYWLRDSFAHLASLTAEVVPGGF